MHYQNFAHSTRAPLSNPTLFWSSFAIQTLQTFKSAPFTCSEAWPFSGGIRCGLSMRLKAYFYWDNGSWFQNQEVRGACVSLFTF